MNNYCRNCGNKLNNGDKVCSICNTEIIDKRVDLEKLEEDKQREKKYLKLIIIIFMLTLMFYFLSAFIDFLYIFASFFLVLLIIVVVTACIKNQNSKIFKILLTILILYWIFDFLTSIFLMYLCSLF